MDKKVIKALEKGDAISLSKLIASGTGVGGVDKKGNTALHLAAGSNSLEICTLLVAQGCDPLARNKKGETPFMVAEGRKKKRIAAYLKEAELGGANTTSPPAVAVSAPPVPSAIDTSGAGDRPHSAEALVNVLTYNMETSAWESISEDTQLKLEYTPHTFVLCAADTSGKGGQCLNDTLDESFVFSKSTDEFYNYRLGDGPIYGFQFLAEDMDAFCDVMDKVPEWMASPPPVEAPPTPPHPAPAAEAPEEAPPSGGPPPPPGGPGGPPPPPPGGPGGPPPPPPPPPAPSAGGGGPISLAAMLNNKKSNLSDTANTDSPSSGGAAPAGNMMSELQKRLQRRAAAAESASASPESTPPPASESSPNPSPVREPKPQPTRTTSWRPKSFAGPVETSNTSGGGFKRGGAAKAGVSTEDLALFKSAIIEDFRAELGAIKEEIIFSLRQELAAME